MWKSKEYKYSTLVYSKILFSLPYIANNLSAVMIAYLGLISTSLRRNKNIEIIASLPYLHSAKLNGPLSRFNQLWRTKMIIWIYWKLRFLWSTMSTRGLFKYKKYNGQCMDLSEFANSIFLKSKANLNFIFYLV